MKEGYMLNLINILETNLTYYIKETSKLILTILFLASIITFATMQRMQCQISLHDIAKLS